MEPSRDPVDWDALGRYFAGESAPEERARLEAWFAADPARRRLLDELRLLWTSAEAPADPPPISLDIDAAWQRLQRARQRGRRPTGAGRPARRPHRRRGALPLFARAAAVVLAGLLTVLALRTSGPGVTPTEEAAPERVYVTERGQRATIQLGDGTRVRLNVDSRLAVPASFAVDRREVRLEGEAFFEVASDTARPFLVYAGPAATEVLGTAFNVNAAGEAVEVVVAEGRVALRAEATSAGAVLAARDLGRLRADGSVDVREGVDTDRFLAWLDGRLVFEDAPFAEVARELERVYNLDVRLADPHPDVERLNARFDDESLSIILETVALSLDLRYTREGTTVTFSAAE